MKNKVLAFLKSNWILLLIILVGLFLRAYKALPYFMYSHDQDLAGWMVKDVLVNHHFRLIGQETSSQGVFIGPIFYYLLIPFYLITGMDPAGPVYLPIILGVLSIISIYYVFSQIKDKKTGLIGALLYSVSILIVFTDREVVPTTPAMIWSIWFFFSLWKIYKGQQKYYILAGILLGVVWDVNLALGVTAPLIILAQWLSRKRLKVKLFCMGLIAFVVLMLPFIAFEARHDFQQTKALVSSVTTQKDYVPGAGKGLAKLDRVMQLVYKNTTRMFWGSTYPEGLVSVTFFALLCLMALLVYRNVVGKGFLSLMFIWLVLFVLFFTSNPINVSEYYLNGMNIIWIAVASLGLSYYFKNKTILIVVVLLAIMVVANVRSFFNYKTNGNGYIEKKELLAFIKSDADSHGYPCVAISYITAPGYDFGFRYLLWIDGIKTKDPGKGAPVYSIVFPLSFVDHFDERFGGLGLVLPDYKSYTITAVEKICEGVDTNLAEPLFGYTQ